MQGIRRDVGDPNHTGHEKFSVPSVQQLLLEDGNADEDYDLIRFADHSISLHGGENGGKKQERNINLQCYESSKTFASCDEATDLSSVCSSTAK